MITKEQFGNVVKDDIKRQELGKAMIALQKAFGCKIQIVWIKDHLELTEEFTPQ